MSGIEYSAYILLVAHYCTTIIKYCIKSIHYPGKSTMSIVPNSHTEQAINQSISMLIF